eukprot:TRINITY_DN7121_c0_g1_i3.p1 TRINITY_DN7121_c0_g1~~TRINITY_DN7121_c0_g1_i3.p1  ORF type:complete len:444 (+),score=20.28 TRINITY_DN7121_c0_g1_i3:38-1369(+)
MGRFGESWSPFRKLIYLSVVFFLTFISFNTIQNLAAQIYEKNGYFTLGKICLFAFNITFCLGSFASSKAVDQIGINRSLFLSSIPILLVYIAGIGMAACVETDAPPTYCQSQIFIIGFHLVSYLCAGVCIAFLWSAQAGYLSELASTSESGRYFGYFLATVNSSFIVGNILPSIVFRIASTSTFFVLLLICASISVIMFYWLPPAGEPNGEQSNQLLAVEENRNRQSAATILREILPEMKRILELRKNPAVKPWIFFFLLFGFTQAYNFGFIYRMVEIALPEGSESSYILAQTAQMFIIFGVGISVFGIFVGKAIDHFGTRFVAKITIIGYFCYIGLSFIQLFFRSYLIACIIGGMGGTADVFIETLLCSAINKEFEGSLDYFGLFRAIQVFGASAGFTILIALDTFSPIWTILLMGSYIGLVWIKLPTNQNTTENVLNERLI